MPRLFLPFRSIDKTAALSLYRALLQQCRTVEASHTQASLRNVVRNKFRDNRAIVGVKSVKEAFEAGYEALHLFIKCNNAGSKGTSQLQRLLERIPAHLKKKTKRPTSTSPPSSAQTSIVAPHQPIPPSTLPPTTPPPTTSNTSTNTPTILLRPHPLTSFSAPPNTRRRIPTWVEANGIPFLRTQKPIPHALSAYLNKRIKHRQLRTDNINYFEQYGMRLAQDEDIWDGIVRDAAAEEGVVVAEENVVVARHEIGAGKVVGGGNSRGKGDNTVKFVGKKIIARLDRHREALIKKVKWDWGVRGIVEGLWTQVRAEKAKNLWWSSKLKEVVEEEKALAAEEKRDWDRKRRREKRIAKGLAKKVREEEGRVCAGEKEEETV